MRIHFEKTGADDRWFSPRGDDADDGKRFKSIYRWSVTFQNDWAARADWCVKPYAQCNHNPVVVCNGDRTRKVLELPTDPGDVVKLDAVGTSDPAGNKVSYTWWVYKEAGSYSADAWVEGEEKVSAATLPAINSSQIVVFNIY